MTSLVHTKLPILIKGAPGVGKTDIIKEACDKSNNHLIISHPVVSDPVDYKGFPYVIDNEAHFLPFEDLNQLIQAAAPTVYFMDDLGQAPAAVQACRHAINSGASNQWPQGIRPSDIHGSHRLF